MRVRDYIVGLATSTKKAESLTDLESFYIALSQQVSKGEPGLSRYSKTCGSQKEGGANDRS